MVLELTDRKTGDVAWHGVYQDNMTGKAPTPDRIQKAVGQLVKTLPVGALSLTTLFADIAMADIAADLSRPYRVIDGSKFRLKDFDTDDRAGVKDKERAQDALRRGVERLAELQDMLYAQDRYAVLFIFQAMDAAGKDSAIKHVMSGVNPQGCQVFSFKAPSTEELDHDFLWRTNRCLPERGRIGIFNRSYYEETLVVRVHRELLERQHLPPASSRRTSGRSASRTSTPTSATSRATA